MDSIFIFLGIGNMALMAIAVPLVMQKIKPNRFWGIAMIASGLAFFLFSALLGNWRADAYGQQISIALFLVAALLFAVMTIGKLRDLKKE